MKHHIPIPKPVREGGSWILILAVMVIVIAGVLRLLQWINPPTDKPLLTQVEGMIRIASLDDERLSGELTSLLPKETFGGSVHVIGLYPEGGPNLPKNSISVVYTKDNWRILQVDLLPQTTIEEVLGPFNTFRQETVTLPGNRSANLINIKSLLDCVPSRSKTGIGSCRFTRLLTFEIEPGLIGRLEVDGEKMTDGELIETARSMVSSIDATTTN